MIVSTVADALRATRDARLECDLTPRSTPTLYTLTTRTAYPEPSGSQAAPLFWAEPRALEGRHDVRVVLTDGRRATLAYNGGSRRTLYADTRRGAGHFGIGGIPVPAGVTL